MRVQQQHTRVFTRYNCHHCQGPRRIGLHSAVTLSSALNNKFPTFPTQYHKHDLHIDSMWMYLRKRYYSSRVSSNSNTISTIQRNVNSAQLPNNNHNEPVNELNIQLLSPHLHHQIFPNPARVPQSYQVEIAKAHLKKHRLADKTPELLPSIDFDIPKLLGSDIERHFFALGMEQSEPYREMAVGLTEINLHDMPKAWSKRPGWSVYDPVTGESQPVPAPEEDVLVFDVETIVNDSPHYPAMAAAASSSKWYSWVSPQLFTENEPIKTLIPLGERNKHKLVVGHHVAFDRARVFEEYRFEGTNFAWIDTLSLHSAVGGLSSQQRPLWSKWKKQSEELENPRPWLLVSSTNSLQDIVELYCGIKLDKTERNLFVKGTRKDIQDNFQDLMTYCATDVLRTHDVYKVLYPKFESKCPHPVSFAGMLHMGKGFLPVTKNWESYIANADRAYQQNQDKIEKELLKLANDALELKESETYKSDPWLRHLDWNVPEVRYTQPKFKKDGTYRKNGEPRPVKNRKHLPTQPQWYRDLYNPKDHKVKITTRQRITPYLLKLEWRGYPLYYTRKYGWTFVVPMSSKLEGRIEPLKFAKDPESGDSYDAVASHDTEHFYYRIPHKDGDDVNCGDPLSKSYISAFDDGILTSRYDSAREILRLNAECAYWTGTRDRVREQFVVWDDRGEFAFPASDKKDETFGVILPQSKVMGTITRRAVEPTWMTASNAKRNRIGSELKSQVVSPPGYAIVGADVDSQELWISSLLGDSQFRIHGATAFGWMTLQGTKSDGTDLHSRSAQILGISRDSAKVFNYSRIYGAGIKHATSLLLQFNPSLDRLEARKKALKLYEETKGVQHSERPGLRKGRFWGGGTESYMFNKLEEIATSADPRTPTLSCQIPEGLTPENAKQEFLPSRINWVVQSSGVDYLHLLLVSMDYLARKFHIRSRFMISIHDEIRFLVHKDDVHRAALALQIGNLWTRAIFSSRCGVDNLPQSVAFFSAIDIDHCLRKEVDMDCITPSNPTGIEPGVKMDIYDILKATQGRLGSSQDYEQDPSSKMEAIRQWVGKQDLYQFIPNGVDSTLEPNAHRTWLKIQNENSDASAKSMYLDEAIRRRRSVARK